MDDVNVMFDLAEAAKLAMDLVVERRNIRDVMGDPLTLEEAMTVIANQDLELDLLLETLSGMFTWLEGDGEPESGGEPEAEA